MTEREQHVRRLCGYLIFKQHTLPRDCCFLWIFNLKDQKLLLDVDDVQKCGDIAALTSVTYTDLLTGIQDSQRQIMIKNHWPPVKQ